MLVWMCLLSFSLMEEAEASQPLWLDELEEPFTASAAAQRKYAE